MKLCPKCDQPVGEEITICPSCGTQIGRGRRYIDDYRIVDVLHEGHASFLCHAIRERTNEMVMIRLFTPQSRVDEEVASRLRQEIEELKKLPHEGFVKHYAIRRASDGLWYRISEWVDAETWGSLLASGRLSDRRALIDLFYQIASILSNLHQQGYFIPHLILNDIMVISGDDQALKIKIDYKLFRFFDPKLKRPGPMLERLLTCHPDLIHQRPLDFRSDIWSLGKIFVELLTADLEAVDFLSKVEELHLPSDLEILLKVMLADDPDLRPRSMAEVAGSLARIREAEAGRAQTPAPEEAAPPPPAVRGRPKKMGLLAAVVVLVFILGLLAWFQLGPGKKDPASALEDYANQYAPSVAFLVVEYWLEANDEKVYGSRTEGTAFLVDQDGHLLTSRHVACPWLEDVTFLGTVQQFRRLNVTPRFGYRMFLWFEGTKAFNRAARLLDSPELSDVYFVDTAFKTDSTPRVSIVGIPKTLVRTQQLLTSPFKDDFAVLKIDRLPEGLRPLPLDLKMEPQGVPKLSRLIILGFPLGSRTQADSVNVSVTGGHVRRSFENMLQVDASVYSGNSGGPAIDTRGKVIGIVCGVASEVTQGFMPMLTPRWDMGMVLPITKAVEFLDQLKAGQVKWNGVPDFSVEKVVKKITEAAAQGRWVEARAMADKELELSHQPPLVMAAAMLHLCTGDLEGAKRLFTQALSMDAENREAELMLYLIHWLAGDKMVNPHRDHLLAMDWRSPGEFQGYLVRLLEGLVDEGSALKGWHTEGEKSWIHYVAGLIRLKQKDLTEAERLMREAVLAADAEAWQGLLARSKLEEIQKGRRALLASKTKRAKYNADVEAFNQSTREALAEKESRTGDLAPILAKLTEQNVNVKDKIQLLEEIQKIYPLNRKILLALAFYSAADSAWPQALDYIQTFLKEEGREESGLMSARLLKAGIVHFQKLDAEARASLEAFVRETTDPWYLIIGEYLLGKQTEEFLKQQAGQSPENLLTGYTSLGFWAEGSGETDKAIRHYKEALGSFLDDWFEYDFARERLAGLKKPSQ
ncbi:MAG: trypsin-like peptidase domain-containing protein [Proteobacteria bacterium]|nr:trypsin-like peptidase domain-containing protein [Pseudomonadota bacterium]